MKYIDTPDLSRLAQALSHDGPECSVHTRIEAYSCKPITRDKRLYKSLEAAYDFDNTHSPPLPSFIDSELEHSTPFGPIDKMRSRKTLYMLISTLNVAFPDYEFSEARPSHFAREVSGAAVLNALSTTLVSPSRAPTRAPRTYSSYPPSSSDLFPSSAPTSSSPVSHMRPSPRAPPDVVTNTHPTLFGILDDVIGLTECEVFSYEPTLAADPHANDDADDDAGSVGDDDQSDSDEDGSSFPFDAVWDADDNESSTSPPDRKFTSSPLGVRSPPLRSPRRRGALLWSSHWFFLNRKLKRIVYITIWSRSNVPKWRSDSSSSEESWGSRSAGSLRSEGSGVGSKDRFWGWSGAEGAGARAMGLRAWA